MSTMPNRLPKKTVRVALAAAFLATLGACGSSASEHSTTDTANGTSALHTATTTASTLLTIADTVITATFDASAIAEPVQQATVSTKLMGTVTEMLVREGDHVAPGQVLVRLDARELTARSAQVAASVADADAMVQDATANVKRMRALYADSAATRVQLDAAETAVIRATAGLNAARAAANEVAAMASYAVVRAPFGGMITARMVDVGAFAAPGAPLVTIQDASTLRIVASASGEAVRHVTRGQTLNAVVDGQPITVTVEGVVPGAGTNQFTVNATLTNRAAKFRAGSVATLSLPHGLRTTILVPQNALVREGDLTGVIVRTSRGDERRWVRIGVVVGNLVEVTSGLRSGDQIVVPTVAAKLMPADGKE